MSNVSEDPHGKLQNAEIQNGRHVETMDGEMACHNEHRQNVLCSPSSQDRRAQLTPMEQSNQGRYIQLKTVLQAKQKRVTSCRVVCVPGKRKPPVFFRDGGIWQLGAKCILTWLNSTRWMMSRYHTVWKCGKPPYFSEKFKVSR